MKSTLMVFGGVFGSAILLTALGFVILALIGHVSVPQAGGVWKSYVALVVLIAAALGVFATPAFAIMNYLEPENPLNRLSAIIVIVAGAIAGLALLIGLFIKFSWLSLVAILAAVFVVISGLLQGEFVDLPG